MGNNFRKLTGKELLKEWELFRKNPIDNAKKLYIKTGYISKNGEITFEDTKEFNRALALAKKELKIQKTKENNDLNKLKSIKSNSLQKSNKLSENVSKRGKRKVNIRPRLRDKELLEYLEKHNFENTTSRKEMKKLMLETGYSIPFKEVTKKDIYVFFKAFLEADKKYRGKQTVNINSTPISKHIEEDKGYSIFEIKNVKAPKADGQTYVYLMRDGKAGTIKIGMSNNVKKRMTSIINEYFVWPVELIFCLPFPSRDAAESMESFLHRKYSDSRSFSYSTRNGSTSKEWFNLNKNQVEEIKNILNKNFEARNNPRKKRYLNLGDLIPYAFLIFVGFFVVIYLSAFALAALILVFIIKIFQKLWIKDI